MNPRLAWPAVAVTVIGAIAATAMALSGVPQETILLIMALLVTPTATAMVAQQVAEVKASSAAIERNTNGTNSELLSIIRAQGELLARSSPVLPTEPPKE